jgi:hypothetical protein
LAQHKLGLLVSVADLTAVQVTAALLALRGLLVTAVQVTAALLALRGLLVIAILHIAAPAQFLQPTSIPALVINPQPLAQSQQHAPLDLLPTLLLVDHITATMFMCITTAF